MNSIDLISKLDYKSNSERLATIVTWLTERSIPFKTHSYSTGKNLIVDVGQGRKIGVSSHFDRVDTTAGANDNSSAIAVCLNLILRFYKSNEAKLGLRFFFFDEEENGLRGSSAYVNDYGVSDLIGLINLEMVGRGDMIALWPVSNGKSSLSLNTLERISSTENVTALRFDQIVTNTADHIPFTRAGLEDVFSITCVSKEDLLVADKYFQALNGGVSHSELFKLLSTAPLFQHYHQPTDTFEKIEEKSLVMVVDLLQKTIISINKQLK